MNSSYHFFCKASKSGKSAKSLGGLRKILPFFFTQLSKRPNLVAKLGAFFATTLEVVGLITSILFLLTVPALLDCSFFGAGFFGVFFFGATFFGVTPALPDCSFLAGFLAIAFLTGFFETVFFVCPAELDFNFFGAVFFDFITKVKLRK
jgi:hypothetical protein